MSASIDDASFIVVGARRSDRVPRSTATRATNGVEKLGELRGAWNDYTKRWLVTGGEGELLFAGTSPKAHSKAPASEFAILEFDDNGNVDFNAEGQADDVTLQAPWVVDGGVVRLVALPNGTGANAIATPSVATSRLHFKPHCTLECSP